MITNPEYKLLAGQIANIFCDSQTNKTVCISTLKTRIINVFTNETFNFFIQNLQAGRFLILQYSNWHSDANNCRQMKIDVKLTDVITGTATTGYWHYTADDCQNNQYKFQDLNHLISVFGNILIDAPITANSNTDITKPRLIYSPNAPGYNIVLIPDLPSGGGGGIVAVPPKVPNVPSSPNTPAASGFNISTLITPTTALIATGILAVYLFMKK